MSSQRMANPKMSEQAIPRTIRSSAKSAAARFSCPEDVLAAAIEGLAGCEETVLSETVCGGILDPTEVVEWVDRSKRLLRFRVDEAELRRNDMVAAHQRNRNPFVDDPSLADSINDF